MDIDEIKIKDFNKLKQLDKIELLLRLDRIEKKEDNSHFGWYVFTNFLCSIILFLLLCFVINEKFIILLRLIPPILALVFVIAFIGSLYNSINKIRFKKYKYELKKEFFVEEVKKK